MELDLNKLWDEYIREHSYSNPIGWLEDTTDYHQIHSELLDETRWGVINEIIFRSESDGSLVGLTYEDGVGDADYGSAEMNAEFYPVAEESVTVVRYVKVK